MKEKILLNKKLRNGNENIISRVKKFSHVFLVFHECLRGDLTLHFLNIKQGR